MLICILQQLLHYNILTSEGFQDHTIIWSKAFYQKTMRYCILEASERVKQSVPPIWWRTHLRALPALQSSGRPRTGRAPRRQPPSGAPTCQETLREAKRQRQDSVQVTDKPGGGGDFCLKRDIFKLSQVILISWRRRDDAPPRLFLSRKTWKRANAPKMDTFLRNSSYIFLFLKVLPCRGKTLH